MKKKILRFTEIAIVVAVTAFLGFIVIRCMVYSANGIN